ncbi:MAG: alpha/beta hydrolase [Pseudohongiella sp.]|nr:MAG: alpha/beta hydrolase [Pseudohongiella sp.]
MPLYKDLYFKSHDGLSLYARDYPASEDSSTLVCIPGLTRNSADFEKLCESLAGEHRILAVDLRGRGRSAYDPNPQNYLPTVYAQDIASLLRAENIDSAIFIGTSLGGMVAMTLAAINAAAVAGIVLNDVGPELNPVGLARIKSYVSNPVPVESWEDAVEKTRTNQEHALPGLSDSQWLEFTKRLYREEGGRPILSFDPKISVLFEAQDADAPTVDLWPLFELLNAIPVMLIRGAHSDILSAESMAKMLSVNPSLVTLEVEGRGHAPLLDEPGVVQAIKEFLKPLIAG